MGMVWTQDDIDNLKEVLSNPAKVVKVGDREVTYRDVDEILRLIDLAQAYVDGVETDADNVPNVIKATFKRGET